MKTNIKIVCIAIMLTFVCVSPVYAIEQSIANDDDIIQVAIPISASGEDKGTNSVYVEYTEEYLHEISQYTGWQYEIIEVAGTYEDGLQSCLDMLRTGGADLIAPIRYRDRSGNGVYFSQSSYVTGTTILQVPNSVYKGVDFGSEVRVAVLRGSGMQDAANEFLSRNNIVAEYIMCENVDQQIQLVCTDKADVMLNSNLEYIPNMSIVAEFSPQSLYFAATDKSLLKKLEQAIIYIKQANTSFSDDLYQDLYNQYASGSTQKLTLEETLFIEQADPYTVAIMEHNAPYQYIDSETGEFRGIAVDILNNISKTTGVQFEFISVTSWDEMLQLIEEGKVQIVAEMPYDYAFASERDLTITRSYSSSPYVLIAPKTFQGPSSGQQLALPDVSAYTDGYYVGDVIRYSTIEACLEAIRSGDADYTYADLYTAQYYLGDSSYNTFDFTPQSYEPRSICFGVVKPTPHELLSILNKSIHQLSATDMQNIITQNVNPPRSITIFEVILAHPLQALLLIGAVSLLIAGMLTFLLWRKEKISKVLRQRAMEDSLTRLYNASACRSLITQKLLEMEPSRIGAFLIMDMDYFKEINDVYGHHAGDEVLQSFANMLCEVLRDGEIIARIGGDEFVVYLDSIRQEEDILTICNRICNRAHSIVVEEKHITVSIGAVVSKTKDDYDTLYKLADKALYKAKHNERDQFHLIKR